jgi:hypothetical protein
LIKHVAITVAVLVASVVSVSSVALAGTFLPEDAVKSLPADTKENCLVQVQLSPKNWGKLDESIKVITSEKEIETAPSDLGLLDGAVGGFAFVVPKGPFRVSYIHYKLLAKAASIGHAAEWETQTFGGIGSAHGGKAGKGDIAEEMSGTCNGGFIYLGLFKGEGSGLTSPGWKLGSDAVEAKQGMHVIWKQVQGTPWQAAVEHPAENKPLPKDQVITNKAMEAEAAAQKVKIEEAGTKTIATLMAQKHDAKAPKSDDGAVEIGAGTYVLTSVNGKPIPVTMPNTCIWKAGSYDLKGDATYATTADMECAGKIYSFPTSGYWGITGDVLTTNVAVGPAAPKGTPPIKVAGGVITSVSGTDTFVFTKK